jgi:hypothetical protein
MGRMSRTKGQDGERELALLLAELTGHDVRRRVRQHDGDSDLEGVPGWSIECKRYASAKPGHIYGMWWPQALEQASATRTLPVLFYRLDRGFWTAVWCADLHTGIRPVRVDYQHTVSAEPATWWAMVKHIRH